MSRLNIGTLIRSAGPLYIHAILLAVSQIIVESLHTTSIKYKSEVKRIENEKLKMDNEIIDNYSGLIEFLISYCQISKIEDAREVRQNFNKNKMDFTSTEQDTNSNENLFQDLNLFFLNQDNDHNIHNNDNNDNYKHFDDNQNICKKSGSDTISRNSKNTHETDTSNDQMHIFSCNEGKDSRHHTISMNEIFAATDNLLETISYFDLNSVYDMQLYYNGEGLRQILTKIPKGFVFGEVS